MLIFWEQPFNCIDIYIELENLQKLEENKGKNLKKEHKDKKNS